MAKRDYYEVLGVRRDAAEKDIKQAYRRLARRYHPDVNPGDAAAEQKFKEISEAYAVLSNPEDRKKYDHFGHQGFQTGFDPAFGGAGSSRDFHSIKDMFGGQGSFPGGLGSIFEDFFGAGTARPHTARTPGEDLTQTVEISFEDAIRGTTQPLQIKRPDGSTERLQVKIPPGIASGARLRLGRKGTPGQHGGADGDLYIAVHVIPHPYFTRQDYDLVCDLPITLEEAMLGAKVDVPTIDGKITMTLPACTQNGRRFRLRGKGVPHAKNGERGDQYVTVRVVLPEVLDERSQQLVAEFAQRNPLQPRVQMRW